MSKQRQPGQYWVKIKWDTAVNGYTWIIGHYKGDEWFIPGRSYFEILDVDENPLVYIEPQYRSEKYEWPISESVSEVYLRNIGQILQDIHQQLVILNQKSL